MPIDTSQAVPQNGNEFVSSIPQKRIVSIEHPCVIKNFNNAFKSLGGEHQLKHVVEHKIGDGKRSGSEPTAVLSLRPDDPLAKKLASTVTPTQNLLMKVSIPKRTGRKRKRGSDEPFTDDPAFEPRSPSITAPSLLERLRDTSGKYAMQVVGTIQETHRFEALPDIQMRADELPIMREIRDRAMIPDYDRLQEFRIDNRLSLEEIMSFPGPPHFITAKQAYKNLGHREEPVLPPKSKPSAKKKKTNDTRGGETGITLVEPGNVPKKPLSTLKTPSRSLQNTIAAMKSLMETRPILTHRAASVLLPNHSFRSINHSAPHVGYYVDKGPWEGCIVKHGLDPRSDPKYRVYQTLQFNFSAARALNKSLEDANPDSVAPRHIFDGQNLTEVAKYWQLLDLTDPVLASLVRVSNIRRDCDTQRFGWYYNGTIAKIRTIMKDKMVAFINREPLLSDAEYSVLASLPERVESEGVCVVGDSWGPSLGRVASQIGKEAMKGPFRTDRMLRRPTAGAKVEGRRLMGEKAESVDETSGDGRSPEEHSRSPDENGVEESDEDVNEEDEDEEESDDDEVDDDTEML